MAPSREMDKVEKRGGEKDIEKKDSEKKGRQTEHSPTRLNPFFFF
jgi:hypothetical protein